MKRAVVDQPGLKIVTIGIVISLFMGLIFKSQVRSVVVKARLQQVFLRLQKDVNIDFESTRINLSEWGLPRPVVEIKGIRISPLGSQCQDNQIFIENLTFPLSFNILFSERKIINSIHISLMEVRVKNLSNCLVQSPQEVPVKQAGIMTYPYSGSSIVSEPVNSGESEPSGVKSSKLLKTRAHLNEVKIDRLRVLLIDKLNSSLDLNAVVLRPTYADSDLEKISHLTALNIQAQLLTFKDPVKNYYMLKSDIKSQIQFMDDGLIHISTDFAGMVLDRAFTVKIKNDPKKKNLQFFAELNNISLKVLNYILKNEKPDINVYDFLTGSSLSGFITGQYSFDNSKTEISFKNAKVVIGDGAADFSEILLNIDRNKVDFKPFDIQLLHIDLSRFLTLNYFDQIRSSVENAGFISGLVQMSSLKEFKIKALIEKMSFVFSNKGQRVSQTFDSFNFFTTAHNSKISVTLNDFILDSEKIKGLIDYQMLSASEQNQQKLKVDISGYLLRPETVQLFTGLLYKPTISLNFVTDLKTYLNGTADINDLLFDQVALLNTHLDYDYDLRNSKENYKFKSEQISFKYNESSNSAKLNGFFDQDIFSKPEITYNNFRMDMSRVARDKATFNIKAENVNRESKSKTELTVTGSHDGMILVDTVLNLKTMIHTKVNTSRNFRLTGDYKNLSLTPFTEKKIIKIYV
ncbi:MAG: hypothetical protein ACK41T_03105 [Pseudobdellovibrio sp.]